MGGKQKPWVGKPLQRTAESGVMAGSVDGFAGHRTQLELENEELREARAELQSNAELLAELYDYAPVGYFSISNTGLIRQLNLMGAQMLGRERALSLGRDFSECLSPGDVPAFRNFVARIFAGEEPCPCEVSIPRSDASALMIRLTGTLSPNGLVCRMAAMDVTEQRRIETTAREKIEDLDRIFNLSHDLLAIAGNDGRFRRVNPAFERVLGHSREVLTSRQFIRFVHPDDREATRRAMARLEMGEDVMDLLNRYRCADGSYRWLEWRVSPYAEGLTYAVARDVSERKKAEDALRESEKRLRLAIDAAQMGSWEWNLQTNRLMWTPYHEVIMGYEPGMPRRSYEDFQNRLHPEDAERVDCCIRRAIEDSTDYACDFRIVWPDESIHWVSSMGRLVCDSAGRAIRMLGMITDITARKKAEESIRRSEQKFRSIVESSPTAIYLYQLKEDGRLVLIEANYAADKELGIKHRPLIGMTLEEAFPKLAGSRIPEVYRAVAEGNLASQQFELGYEDGAVSGYFNVHVFQTNPGMIAVMFSDISEQKSARESLDRHHEDLELRVQRRTAQLHERTLQLRALTGELIHAEERERRRIAGLIHEDLQQMLVAAMLNLGIVKSGSADKAVIEELTRIENILRDSIHTARSLTAELSQPVLQQSGLAAAFEWLRSWCGEKYGLDMRIDVEEGVEAGPEVSATLFRCVRELFLNIVKHAGVRSAMLRMWRADRDLLKIEVSDEGVGFDPGEVRAREGSVGGFGLFSVRERLEWLEGGFEIQSSPGGGSRFTLWVPLAAGGGNEAPHSCTGSARSGADGGTGSGEGG